MVALFVFLGLSAKPAAAANNNQTINFQGRLLNSQGATVTDGFYNIQFKVYQDGDGQSANDATGSPAGTLKWTENWLNSGGHGVKVVNGFMSVQLGSVTAFGSNIDWNQGNLWLSMNVGDTSSCTITTNFTANCNGDGEMLPMQPLTASPYSLNSGELNGLTSNNFVQLAQGVQTDSSTSSSIFINKTGASGSIIELQKGGVDVMNVSNTGTVLFKPSADSATALQVQNHANGYSVFSVDTSGNAVILGQASSLTGKLQFATAGGGTLTINPTSSASNFTITLPAETGTVCTTAASAACTSVYATTSGTVLLGPSSVQADASNNNSIFINKTSGTGNILELQKSAADVFKIDNSGNVTSTGQNTLSRNSSGANDYTFGVTGTPSATGSSSLVRIGSALTGGNGALNGGTYLSIVEPSSGSGSAADFLNLQNGSTVELQLSSSGNLTVGGTYNGNTFDNSGHLTFGNAGAATISSNGAAANNLTVDTGNSGATLALGNTAGTTNIGTTNAAHTIGIGTGGGGTNTEAVTIGAATNSSSTLTLQGGSAGSSIVLQTGNNGATAGAIQIGNTSGGQSQTIYIGTNNAASSTNVVNLGTGTSTDNVTIGDNTAAASSVSLKAGSTGGISLGANTTLSANSNFSYASGTGGFDAHNASGTFQTSTGNNSLNGATTVTGTNTFTVNGGATVLNGAAAGSGTAAKINTNAASNNGLVVQGAASQTAPLFVLQDSTGASILTNDASGNQERGGYLNTPYGGIGSYGNLVVQSEQLGTTWSASNITVTPNDAASNPAPDGNITADKLVAAAAGTATLTQTYASAGNNTYTFSIWLKTNSGGDTAQLRIDSNGTPATGTAKTFNITTTWQRFSVTQSFTSGVSLITPTLIMNNSSTLVGWGAQLVQASTAQVYVKTVGSIVAASDGLVSNGTAIFQNSANSATAYQFLNASGANVATVDSSNGQVVLGSGSGSVTGQIKFNFSGQTGSITLAPLTPSSNNYTINLPAENGTICTTAAAGACSAAGSGYVQLAPTSVQADGTNNNSIFINKTSGTGNILELQKSAGDVFKVDNSGNVSSTGQNTLSRNSSGANDYSFGVTGTPSATGSSSLVRIGGALTGGNGAANGGTYLSIVEPSSGAGSAADFFNLQNGSTVELQLTSGGNLTVGGTYNGNTFDNSGHLTFGNAGAATISSNGAAANNLTVDTGNSGATLILGNTAGTTSIGTSNGTHTINIATGGGGTNTEAVTIGAATNSSSTLTLQGGNGGSAISLLTGINGAGTLGGIQIGNGSSANSQTISIGSSNTNASGTNVVNIGSAATATDNVTIGSTSNANSSVSINGGSSGGITLTASTTNINSATVASNQSTLAVFNSPTNVTEYQAGTSISIGATSGTLSIRNANQTFGNAAGSGLFTNNGATVNSTLALGDFPTGGAISASPTTSVDIYTSISVAQTTTGQALTIPNPTASTTYGRVIYLSNIGSASFTIGGIRIPPGDTATMMWANTNLGASWQFAGAGASSIENQNTNDQTADFRISGTGRANTSFISPLFDALSGGSLSVGTSSATSVTVGGTTNTTSVLLQGAASAAYTIGTSSNTGGITVGNSTASNTISIGGAQTATGNTQTVNVGTLATGTGKAVITIGNTNGASSVTIQAGSGGITLTGPTSVSGSNTFATGTGAVSLNGDTTVASGKELILGGNGSDLTCTNGAIFYRSDTNRFRGCENGTWIYIDNYSDVKSYTSGDNTWTMPTNAATVEVILIGGGGGGGGGGARNGGQERNGGGGGGGGAYASQIFTASDLASTAHASVGGSGSSGTGAASSATAGGNGGNGGASCFSSAANCTGTIYVEAYGGGGGGGGNQSGTAGGGGGGGGGTAAVGGTASNTSNTGATGGNPAGGAANANVSGGSGGGGGTSGSATTNAGNAGGAAEYGGGGGGGAGGGNSASGNGGSSLHGAGGGGGGASTNSGNSTGPAGAGGVSQSNSSGGGGTAGSNTACPGGVGGNGSGGSSIKAGSGGGGGGANGGGGAAGCNGGNGGAPGGGGGGGGSGSTSAGNGGTGGAGEIWVISW